MTRPEHSAPAAEELARARALAHQARLTKPPGSLGRLEEVAVQMAAFQATETPQARPCSVLLFAADHPVSRRGVSAYPREVTRAMLQNFLHGGAAAAVLCRLHRLALHVADVGVEGPGQTEQPVGTPLLHRLLPQPAAGDISEQAALSEVDFHRCREFGASLVSEHCHQDRLVILGEMGIGNTTPATALGAALLELDDPAALVGRGTGATGEVLRRKQELVSRAVARVAKQLGPEELLRELGGREMVAMYGAMEQALAQRQLILIDGFIVTAVALTLIKMDPRARHGMLFAHCSDERGHRQLLEAAGVEPLLCLGMRLGEASGALTAFPILEAACATHNQMATFESASIPNSDPSACR